MENFLCTINKVIGKPDVITSTTLDPDNQIGNFVFKKSLLDDYLNSSLFPIYNADFPMLLIL
jgi:hypothetical protein